MKVAHSGVRLQVFIHSEDPLWDGQELLTLRTPTRVVYLYCGHAKNDTPIDQVELYEVAWLVLMI